MNSENGKNNKNTKRILQLSAKYLMPTYARIPIALDRGDGVRVWDTQGRCYLDFLAGIAVMSLGHSHEELVETICNQAGRIIHCSNLYHIESQARLAQKLSSISFAQTSFFCNSGAEANEAAIKLARKSGYDRGAFEVIAMENSFHGRTIATVALTGQDKYRTYFGPYPPGFKFARFNDSSDVEKQMGKETCAVIIEPIQGEGGIHEASAEFLRDVRELCDRSGALLIFDEVQCGLGRTGRWFAHELCGVEPDIMTLAKPLAGGLPIGALLAGEKAAHVFAPGDHASTFGGGALITSVALKVLEIIERDSLIENAATQGEYFKKRLTALMARIPIIKELRGQGLMLGLELNCDARPILDAAREKGLLIGLAGARTLRFVPPLIITAEHVDEAVDILESILLEAVPAGS